MAKSSEKDEFNLEEGFNKLDEMVKALENPDINLEDSFKIYQEGMELLKKCSASIDDVEKKVLVLEENGGIHEFQRKSGD